jgi:hypothetical protein
MKPRYVSLKQLSEETGLAVRTLQYIRAREPGVLPQDPKGQYIQPDCSVNLRNREATELKKKIAEESTPDTIKDANRRQAIADAALSELKLDRERAKVIEKSTLELELRDLFRKLRTRILAIRLEQKHRFVNLPDEARASKELYSLAVHLLGTLQQAGPILGEVIAEDPEHESVEVPAIPKAKKRGNKAA